MVTPEARSELEKLLSRATMLEASLCALVAGATVDPDDAGELMTIARRLRRSVIRPLGGAAAEPAGAAAVPDLGEHLWELTLDATRLRLSPGVPTELQEATAALQDLACGFLGDDARAPDRLVELWELQAELPRGIRTQSNGPYLVTNVRDLTNWLGEPLPTRPQMALCRCGGSAVKPLCDGTHAEIGFTDRKDPERVPDRRDAYVGQQLTVLDNRGICQHSGYCSDRLATVFRVGEDSFVAPSGGRMDEIIRAVRDCPSGALSYAIDGPEARDEVDRHGMRDVAIEVSQHGPYRVTGRLPLRNNWGEDEHRSEGASREHYALCRCGRSQNKPFCSGMHWYVQFKDPVPDPEVERTVFEWCGGLPALTRMTRIFYEKYVPEDPLLAPLFATMSPDHPERVAKWLAEVFGGPNAYSEDYGGYSRMVSEHVGKALTEDKRARWVELILRSAEEAGLPADAEFRSVFTSYIEWGSRLALENSQSGARPPVQMPMPRWDWHTAAGPPEGRTPAVVPSEDEESPVTLPGPAEDVSFDRHIKPMFRRRDRQSMKFVFDLWAYDDVRRHAEAILKRLQNGSMPCDGAWSQEKIDAFERWTATGMCE